ncbi:MAG TPA: hypothetical protein ENK23_07230, partial [Sorangium sp.]|nr:hypothetical protein [Sorangium sp.]
MSTAQPINNATFRLASGEWLDVREFHIQEEIGKPFYVKLTARHEDPDLDLEGFVGEVARFELAQG